MVSLWFISKTRHHANKYILVFKMCTPIYVQQCTAYRKSICWHYVYDNIFLFETCTCPPVQECTVELTSQSWHHAKDTFGREGGPAICILRLVRPIKIIREKYPNHTKSHKFKKILLIAEAEKKTGKTAA